MGGMINNNTKVGFDSQNRPVVAYHKFDAAGNTQLFNARVEGGRWVTHQTSNWNYRWNFGGGGTLIFQIQLDGVKVEPDGTLVQVWYHMQYGGWNAFRLDETTLASVATIGRTLPYPVALDTVESTTAGDGRAVGLRHGQRSRPRDHLHAALGNPAREHGPAARDDSPRNPTPALRFRQRVVDGRMDGTMMRQRMRQRRKHISNRRSSSIVVRPLRTRLTGFSVAILLVSCSSSGSTGGIGTGTGGNGAGAGNGSGGGQTGGMAGAQSDGMVGTPVGGSDGGIGGKNGGGNGGKNVGGNGGKNGDGIGGGAGGAGGIGGADGGGGRAGAGGAGGATAAFDRAAVMSIMRLVADHEIARFGTGNDNGWVRAAFHTGMLAAYRALGDVKYRNYTMQWGQANAWQLKADGNAASCIDARPEQPAVCGSRTTRPACRVTRSSISRIRVPRTM